MTKWNCKYHIVFAPKYRRKVFFGEKREGIGIEFYGVPEREEEQHGNLKYKYRGREFWCRGYYVDTVGKNKQKIAEYIRHQLDEDKLGEQMTMFGKDGDPFKGGK